MKKSWLSVATRYEKPGELKNLRCPADAKAALQEMAICGGANRECSGESCAKPFQGRSIDYRKPQGK